MIRNWYNQIPYPALKTKREITKYINWRQFTKGTRGKQNEQLFPMLLTSNAIVYVSDVMFQNTLCTQVLKLKSLLLIKINSSNFQEMFIKASSFLLFKYLNFDLYTLKVPFIRSWPRMLWVLIRTASARRFKMLCCGYSLELPWWGYSNEYPQHVFLENWQKLSFSYHQIPSLSVLLMTYISFKVI